MGPLPKKYLEANDPNLEYWTSQSVRAMGYENLKVPVLCSAGLLGGSRQLPQPTSMVELAEGGEMSHYVHKHFRNW